MNLGRPEPLDLIAVMRTNGKWICAACFPCADDGDYNLTDADTPLFTYDDWKSDILLQEICSGCSEYIEEPEEK